MNGKRAKQLRRAARESTQGLPARSYMIDERRRKEYDVIEDKQIVKKKFSRTIMLAPSARHFYHLLRQQYRQWQEQGEVKAREVRKQDAERSYAANIRKGMVALLGSADPVAHRTAVDHLSN